MSYRAWRARRAHRQWRRLFAAMPHELRVFVIMVLRTGR